MVETKQAIKSRENRITFKKHTFEGIGMSFISLPWNNLIAGIGLFIIGLLDYHLLGHLIGHPEDPTIGEYVGQGNAVFLGGISFFYTVGLIPFIVGIIMLLYCVFAVKEVSISSIGSNYTIQERKALLPTISEIEVSSIKRISYSNRGMQFRNTWILLFIPMAVRILQYGIPIFGEHRAQDAILPIMMVITAVVDLLVVIAILIFPYHEVILESSEKNYILNFFPITKFKAKSLAIQQIFQLIGDSPGKMEDLWKLNEHSQELMQSYQRVQKNYVGVLFGGFLLLCSLIGITLEFLWGTDLSMVGITYGLYLILKSFIYDFSNQIVIDHEEKSTIFMSNNGAYFTKIGYFHTEHQLPQKIDLRLRNVNLIDLVGIGLLLYLSSLELIWSCLYLNIFNWLILIDLILTWMVWLVVLFGMYVYLIIPISYIIPGDEIMGIPYPIFHPKSRFISFKEIRLLSKTAFHSDQKIIRQKVYMRLIGMVAVVVAALIVALL